MRFRGLDLNLLVAFDTLITLRSVSAAARQMNLSQPAMSAALGRLRDYFGDDILVANGKRMYPTAYAESLVPRVRECLQQVETLIGTSTIFEPATSHRVFRIITSDYIIAAIVVPLVARLAEIAPNVRLELILPSENSPDQVAHGRADLLITPENFISRDQPSELLFEEQHVVVGWDQNPIFDQGVTEEAVLAAGHVVVQLGNQQTSSFADRQLELLGKVRKVEVATSSFTTIPWLLRDTMRLAVMHERLAIRMKELFPIRWAPLPFEFPVMREMVQYHRARSTDEGLNWLRGELHAIARQPINKFHG